jgi:hypothetical protein
MSITAIIIISILSLLVVIFMYTSWNLLRKFEKQEDIITQYDDYITEFNKQIEFTDERLKKIDEKGMFFEQIKVIQDGISRFKIN